jgi:hypothetical protein
MDTAKSFDLDTKPVPAIQEIDLEIEELDKITAPKLIANHNETFVLSR